MAAKKKAKKTAKKIAKKAAPKRAAKRAPAKTAKKRAAAKKPSGPVIRHWEIQAKDPKKLHDFYSELFGWKIDAANPMNYGMVASGGQKDSINGGIGGAMGGTSRVLVYAEVEDINDLLERAEALGARTIMPRTDIGPVIMGVFEDLEGNQFGIIEG